ncbi:transposase-like DNA-binding protein [Roseinatronobacter monicus]|uniref:Transposase-like DNA-binding protein n=1 Tax=Roseinatronobacter monicus TaxID=393481 RepID=A0A543K606_9RHOB|nr:transposase [Roseinatronobacter monicus]TQM90510.1 transposase-like DNA-binding protein [Roseinatronobacter monicus]
MGQTWVETETAGCDLGDVRLNRRLEAMLQALGQRLGESLPTAFQDSQVQQKKR